MKQLSKIMLLALGLASLAVVWTSVPGRTTSARETDGNVQLQCATFTINDVCNTWVKVADDGTTSAFSIPSGRELRVTDIEWNSSVPGFGSLMVLIAEPGGAEVIRAVSSNANTSFANGNTGSIHLQTPVEFSALPLVGVGGNDPRIVYIQGTLGPA